MTVLIHPGDCRTILSHMPAGSVDCCVTSPPYFGLRDYGHAGQMGLEATPVEYGAGMVDVFRHVRRVLRKEGTLWLNIGDSYAGSWGAQSREKPVDGISADQVASHPKRTNTGSLKAWRAGNSDKNKGNSNRDGVGRVETCKPKDLIGIPWLLAFALRADGWYLRQDIIWSKPNPMPESVRDRCTKAHEYLFLLSKGPRYFYDADAISEPGEYCGQQLGIVRGVKVRAEAMGLRPSGNEVPGADATAPDRRNKRSVWTVATQPFSEAHFATFPPALIEPCILAGCPKDGTVLDPFFGAGTTGLVADRLQRDCIGIELNPEYAAMARRRIDGDRGALLDAMEAA